MDRIVSLVVKVPRNLRYDDDPVDRLSHRFTSLIIVVFAVLISMTQYVGKPITCWVPKHFTGSHTKYANSHCWVKNTYWLPFEEEIPKHHEEERRREIIYYQWMPFILLTQAFFFYLPSAVWRAFNSKAGVDSDDILASAGQFQKSEKIDSRDQTLRLITGQIHRFLMAPRAKRDWRMSVRQALSSVLCCLCGKGQGNYLIMLYLFVKLLYIANVFGQLFVLNSILKTSYNLFGIEAIENAMEEKAWLNATVFPKVTMCDFHIRRLGNVQRYTVQCLLSINLYTERMYIFLWFWMVVVLTITCLSLLVWIMRSCGLRNRSMFIRRHLRATEHYDFSSLRSLCQEFTGEYLRHDGVFLLRLIGHNTDGITVDEITSSLWEFWMDKRKKKLEERAARENTHPIRGAPNGKPPLPLEGNGLVYRPGGLPTNPPKFIPTTEKTPLSGLDEPDMARPVSPSAPGEFYFNDSKS